VTFAETIREAVARFAERGFTSEADLNDWLDRLRRAAEATMTSRARMEEMLRAALKAVYDRLVEKQSILQYHPGISRFTLANVKPKLHAELTRRILASANLIKLNREDTIAATLRRFAGWATSIPPGGSPITSRREAAADISKAMQSLPYISRRVLIDQGHRLTATINSVLAHDGGAIAAKWRHHHVTYPRPIHLARDGKIFLIRNSWAHQQGFVKRGENGYTDEIEMVGELPYCRCTYQWLYALRQLPDDVLTDRGRNALAEVRVA
jgi:hypothetical protein